MDNDNSGHILSPTGGDAISATAFYVLTWVFFGLCNVAFTMRAYIRYACFRRLLLEDYLMLVALAMHIVEAVLIQIYVQYAYTMESVEKGDLSGFGPNFFPNSKKAFVAIGTSVNLTIIGVLIVKLNFLLFFRRLAANIRMFTIMWWAVLIFTVAGAVAQIAMQQFGCFFGAVDYLFSDHCTDEAALRRIFFNAIFSASVDALSDILIIGFPVAILWKSRISMRKKLILTFIFSLVFITIAITIVRGSVFHKVYNAAGSEHAQMQSATFTWFWFYCEFTVAFIVACIVSFRTLFVQRENISSARAQEQQQREEACQSAIRKGWRARMHRLHDSVLDTCKSLEGWSGSEAETLAMRGLPGVASGLMTVDFNDDTNWSRTATEDGVNKNSVERPVSVQSC
ncbi:hypothetical protein G7Y89_g1573 [Cudoniella acicularis]|uniref:Rhodopsin domain-containing protein n=1 Tax=Cudoniella acicularis TaxID=354080 RepID=A0A8H4RVT0_9HELO|nr:hypothetical protein G7Y89_g1573 [Cudoniella acicularis]